MTCRSLQIASPDLVLWFLAGARQLVAVLSSTPQSHEVWTWTPIRHDVAFVTRHQVQEIVVHDWGVANVLGRDIVVDSDIACDAIEEFPTFSLSSEASSRDRAWRGRGLSPNE